MNEIQFYKTRVDIFLMAAVLPHHVRIDLCKDGTMLEYQRYVPGLVWQPQALPA
jgi:hypothetical protein